MSRDTRRYLWVGAASVLLVVLGVSALLLYPWKSQATLHVRGSVTDERGEPLRGVIVSVREVHEDPTGSRAKTEERSVVVAEQLDLTFPRAASVTLHLYKPGYYGESFTFRAARDGPTERAIDVVLKRQRQPVTLQRAGGGPQRMRFRAPNAFTLLSVRRAVGGATPSPNVEVRTHELTGPDPEGFHGIHVWAACEGNVVASEVKRNEQTWFEHRVPSDVRLRMTGEADGFARADVGDRTAARREMFEAPVAGYARELVLSRDELRALVTEGHGPRFYFRIDGLYGRGHVQFMQLADDGKAIELSLSLLIQPDGSRNLEMDED
jgi:hypothetical protein